MSPASRDQNYADALKARCGLSGCAADPGDPCVNSVTGRGPREEPHGNRVVRGRLSPSTVNLLDLADLSTSAHLRQTQQALAASQADLTLVERQLADAERERLAAVGKAADVFELLWATEKERDLLAAELATATAELERLRAALHPDITEES